MTVVTGNTSTDTRMRLVVVGAGGRMGRALIRQALETPGVRLVGALEREGSNHLGTDAGLLAGADTLGVTVSDDPLPLFAQADGVLDFTTPASTRRFAAFAAQAGVAHIVGTTGLSADDHAALSAAARHTAIVQSGNMSLGVNLLAGLVEQAARALPAEAFDIEILEMHHRLKVDAPSGTALLLGEAAARGRSIPLADHSVRVRDGNTGERNEGAIGFATLRGGSVVGDHSVILAGIGERITLSHHAEDRAIFARGALRAALWACERKPGLYTMLDVLGLT